MTDKKLAAGEVAGSSITHDVFPNSIYIDPYPRLAQRLTGASSMAAMVARLRRAVVLLLSPDVTSSGEHGYGLRVT